jgi:DNA-binding NtrC family response regulator
MSLQKLQSSILIVEDEPMVLASLKFSLEAEQFEVTTSTSPIQALKLLEQKDFAVIISDHKMPEMMGLDFLIECRRIRPESSRILLTAMLNLATVVDAINRGEICRFISKPWLREELIAAVRDAAQRHDLATRNLSLQAEAIRLTEELAAAKKALQASGLSVPV